MAKKTRQNVIRVSSELFDLGRKMMAKRGAENFSDYVRGLLLLDAADDSAELLFGHDLPGWVTGDRRFGEKLSRGRDGEPLGDNPCRRGQRVPVSAD